MNDPAIQFQAAGFDSPEVQAQIAAAFEDIRAAFAQLAQACEQAVQMIAEIFTPVMRSMVRSVMRWFQQLRRLHLIPRAYRMTIMRRKIRRYLQMRT